MEDLEMRLREMLMCSVCQDIFRDPRQLSCGHSMCMECLVNLRDHSTDTPFRCPDCRDYFGPVIEVLKSYTLTNIAEEFREFRNRKDAQERIIYCDCCLDKQTVALKTCLKCEVSLCEQHVMDHLTLPVFTGHPLVKPLHDLQERKCPKHDDEVLRFYCKASRRYVCNVCALESKQQSLTTEACSVLRRQLTDYMEQHFERMKVQMKEASESVQKLQEDIQRETKKVIPSDSPFNVVSLVLLCLWFIVLYYAYHYSVENQTLKEALDKEQGRVNHIYSTVAELLVDHPITNHSPAATQDEGNLVFDLDTASDYLSLSDDLRTAQRVKNKIGYPASASRFSEAPQVLSAKCFSTGARIWEVEIEGYFDIAVSYRSIKHESNSRSAFGNNALSWSLTHNDRDNLVAYHDGKKTAVPGTLDSKRIAVLVDIEKGNITFSSVKSSLTRLHEFKAKLTQPVCLGVGLYRANPPSRASIVKVS